MTDAKPPESTSHETKAEVEFKGPLWKHPYVLYALINLAIFLFLIGAAVFAWNSGILPKR